MITVPRASRTALGERAGHKIKDLGEFVPEGEVRADYALPSSTEPILVKRISRSSVIPQRVPRQLFQLPG